MRTKDILLRDRDAKYSGPFDEVFRTEGVRVIKTPIRAPKANVVSERWVGTARRECLHHVLVFGRRHFRRVLRTYSEHYNGEWPHRSLNLDPPRPVGPRPETVGAPVISRRDVLGGLIHEPHRTGA